MIYENYLLLQEEKLVIFVSIFLKAVYNKLRVFII